MPELRTARENARLEIGSQRGRNSHQIGVLGIYDLRGLSYGRTELLVADMRHLAPDPQSGIGRGTTKRRAPVCLICPAGHLVLSYLWGLPSDLICLFRGRYLI